MKCVICDRCKEIIKNPRYGRVITCARPLKWPGDHGNVTYRGNDRQMNEIMWEKELCSKCLDELELFFESEPNSAPPNPVEPAPDDGEDPGDGGEDPGDDEQPENPGDNGGGDDGEEP